VPSVLTESALGPLSAIPRDGDGDGKIHDGTAREQKVPHAPALPRRDPRGLRGFGDADTIRARIHDQVRAAAAAIPPIRNQRHTLTLEDVGYEGAGRHGVNDWKQAILGGRSLGSRLRGTWVLRDNETGGIVDQKRSTIATVPYLTGHGTFIQNGTEYTLAHQLRLRPGVFTRRQANGELEAHVNVMPGQGLAHRIYMEPETGVFRLKVGQSKMPLMALLRAMGASERQLRNAWGDNYQANMLKDDPAVITKLHGRLVRNPDPTRTPEQEVRAAFEAMKLDPEVIRRTLGKPYDRVSLDQMLDTTSKLKAINRGEAEPDDRDHLAYMTAMGPEDLLSERVGRDRMLLGKTLWKASMTGGLQHVPPELLTRGINAAILSSGLGQPTEGINPAMIFDQQARISRLGTGGIPSLDAIPVEARNVQPSHFGLVDPLVTPESLHVGVDSRVTQAAQKGDDGRLYAPFRNVRTGRLEYRSAQDLADAVIAFPGELQTQKPHVSALVGGKTRDVPRAQVQYELPNMDDAFSAISNLVPMKSTVKGQREVMAGRMITQALPVQNPQAPLVQAGIKGSPDDSYEARYGRHLGALHSDVAGTIEHVDPARGLIRVRGDDGQLREHELYVNYPYNRKTYIHQTPVVGPGDRIAPGALLARSNYTDQHGVAALGLNARTAYVPFRGLNFEDAIVVSASMARRMASEHMYQHSLAAEDGITASKKAHISSFPGRFDRRMLDAIDNDGVVKPGTVVQYGDPLITAIKERERTHGALSRGRQASWADHSEIWKHHVPGEVTDVAKTPKGIVVSVKSLNPMEVGDKMCYDPMTSLLTRTGWKPVAEVIAEDELATLNPATDELEYHRPTHLHRYRHDGSMYFLNTKQLNMLVTPNHNLWASRDGGPYAAVAAEEVFAEKGEWRFKKDCRWSGVENPTMVFETYTPYTSREQVLTSVPMDVWLEFLGYYLAEGWTEYNKANNGHRVKIAQFRASNAWQAIHDNLTKLGLRFWYNDRDQRFEIASKWLYGILDPLGDSYTKYVPDYVHSLCPRQLRIFFDAYMAGDGHVEGPWEYGSSSERLAVDVQVICLKLGWAVTIKKLERVDNWQKAPHWRGRVNRSQLHPWVGRHTRETDMFREEMVDYAGDVYCVTVPNHIVYCKREDKTYWSLNSGRYG
jgi:hypothetical protein